MVSFHCPSRGSLKLKVQMVARFTSLVPHNDDWPKRTIYAVIVSGSKGDVHASAGTDGLDVSDGEGFLLMIFSDTQAYTGSRCLLGSPFAFDPQGRKFEN